MSLGLHDALEAPQHIGPGLVVAEEVEVLLQDEQQGAPAAQHHVSPGDGSSQLKYSSVEDT